jgi:hypothetical protein
MNRGLTGVTTEQLKTALRMLHRGELEAPLTIVGLTRVGLQNVANEFLDHLRGVDTAGVRAVLVAVLAERAR